MTQLKLEPAGPTGTLTEGKGTLAETVVRSVAQNTSPVAGLGTIEDIRSEIDDCLRDMRDFYRAEPDMVMRAVSGHSARLIEISIQIGRVEVMRREWKPVREEADRVLQELKNQFAVASRILAQRRDDWDMSGRGQA